MMNESIYSGRGEGIIVIQDFTPIPEGSIGCNDNRAAFIPAGDNLKEEFSPLLVHGQEP